MRGDEQQRIVTHPLKECPCGLDLVITIPVLSGPMDGLVIQAESVWALPHYYMHGSWKNKTLSSELAVVSHLLLCGPRPALDLPPPLMEKSSSRCGSHTAKQQNWMADGLCDMDYVAEVSSTPGPPS